MEWPFSENHKTLLTYLDFSSWCEWLFQKYLQKGHFNLFKKPRNCLVICFMSGHYYTTIYTCIYICLCASVGGCEWALQANDRISLDRKLPSPTAIGKTFHFHFNCKSFFPSSKPIKTWVLCCTSVSPVKQLATTFMCSRQCDRQESWDWLWVSFHWAWAAFDDFINDKFIFLPHFFQQWREHGDQSLGHGGITVPDPVDRW